MVQIQTLSSQNQQGMAQVSKLFSNDKSLGLMLCACSTHLYSIKQHFR